MVAGLDDPVDTDPKQTTNKAKGQRDPLDEWFQKWARNGELPESD